MTAPATKISADIVTTILSYRPFSCAGRAHPRAALTALAWRPPVDQSA